jgi:hypothetical protein
VTVSGYYPNESPAHAIDNNVWTKYNNQGNGPQSVLSASKGVGTGFIVTPYYELSIVTGFQFATGNDRWQRDPLTITLECTNVTGNDRLIGSNWILIYSGETGLQNDPGRSAFGSRKTIQNTFVAKSYRLIVTSQRSSEHSVQYSEAHLYGNVINIKEGKTKRTNEITFFTSEYLDDYIFFSFQLKNTSSSMFNMI